MRVTLQVLLIVAFLLCAWLVNIRWQELSQKDAGYISAFLVFFLSFPLEYFGKKYLSRKIAMPGYGYSLDFFILRVSLIIGMLSRMAHPPSAWWPDIFLGIALLNFFTFTFWFHRYAGKHGLIEKLDAIPENAPAGFSVNIEKDSYLMLKISRRWPEKAYESKALLRNVYIFISILVFVPGLVLLFSALLRLTWEHIIKVGAFLILWFSLPALLRFIDKRKPVCMVITDKYLEWNQRKYSLTVINRLELREPKYIQRNVHSHMLIELLIILDDLSEITVDTFFARKKDILENFVKQANKQFEGAI